MNKPELVQPIDLHGMSCSAVCSTKVVELRKRMNFGFAARSVSMLSICGVTIAQQYQRFADWRAFPAVRA
jgi:hypothetical protein